MLSYLYDCPSIFPRTFKLMRWLLSFLATSSPPLCEWPNLQIFLFYVLNTRQFLELGSWFLSLISDYLSCHACSKKGRSHMNAVYKCYWALLSNTNSLGT